MSVPQPARPETRVAPPVAPRHEEAWTPRTGSPVHALQAAIGEAWEGAPATSAKLLCPGRLALIVALGLAAWVPVVAVAALLLG